MKAKLPTKILAICSTARDTASDIEVTITHVQFEMDGSVNYRVQPRLMNPKTLHPVDSYWTVPQRLKGATEIGVPDHVPLNALGSIATDDATGMTGMVVGLMMHTSGCLHVVLQPSGVNPETGDKIDLYDVDMRRCTGDQIPKLTAKQRVASELERPSPSPVGFHSRGAHSRK